MNRRTSIETRPPSPTSALCGALALALPLALGMIPPAAAAQAAPMQITIAQQPLSAALLRLAEQTSLQIFFTPDVVSGVQAPAVDGRLTPEQALRALLQGTGIRYTREGNNVTLRREDTVAVLAPVTVTARAETADDAIDGYVARRSRAGTKTDTPILETPQSISVVTHDALENQGTLNVANGLRYTAGVGAAAYSNGDGNAFDVFTMRGFVISNSGLLLDGLRLHYNVLDAPTEVYGLERVEVLKGPSSTLYGQSGPSGVVNLISKRPSAESHHEIAVTGGSFDRRQIATDHTGALNEDGTLSYRLTGLFRESDTYIDDNRDDRIFIAPALAWQPSAATRFTLLTSYQKSKNSQYMGLPYSGTVRDNPLGRVNRHTNLGDPDYNYWNTTSKSAGYIFEHSFNDTLTLRQSARYNRSTLQYGYLFPAIATLDLPDNRTVPRQGIRRHDETDTLAVDTNLTGRWNALGGEHTTLVGVDYARSHSSTMNYRGAVAATDLYEPVRGIANLPPTLALRNSDRVRYEQVGLYAQQQSKFLDQWVVTLGGRQDWAENKALSRVSGVRADQRDDAFTGRMGLTYLAPHGIAPYVSFAKSFEPVSGTRYDGTPFVPTEGKQYEVGVKWQPPGSNTLVTLAAYDLRQQNVLTSDPDQINHPGGRVQTGEIRSKGIELEAATDLTRSLRMRAALTFNDSEITRSNVAGEVGRRPPDTPSRMASLWLDYKLPENMVRGLTVGGGVRYVGGTYDGPNAVKTAGYTVYDAMLGYEIERWKFTLNVLNVFDKTYLSSCYAYACYYGQPRTAMLTARYAW
ncbi:ferric siderophore receptor [Bordetella ansorpii]|uniref:Ferric siderophore receptor n=1 Tax=Bordetella ansorpii TaxID=288768 RepID=A0A157NWD2_9BORD|nr:TonB-dependent siderophore receptor [Bordetella ansorpii]SAI25662.1 ferric siderophore receptor [Bordetella ansorpii]